MVSIKKKFTHFVLVLYRTTNLREVLKTIGNNREFSIVILITVTDVYPHRLIIRRGDAVKRLEHACMHTKYVASRRYIHTELESVLLRVFTPDGIP